MISNTKLSCNLAKWLLLVVLFTSCEKKIEKISEPEQKLIVGKKYIISFDWGEKDPFKKIEIDTITIVGLRNGYVQWEYKNGIKRSCKVYIFRLLLEHN